MEPHSRSRISLMTHGDELGFERWRHEKGLHGDVHAGIGYRSFFGRGSGIRRSAELRKIGSSWRS